MSTLTRGRYNPYGQGYEDPDEELLNEEELHPEVRRRVELIVHRQRMTRLRQWWISFVGVVASVFALTGLILSGLGLTISAAAMIGGSIVAALYLTSIALQGRG